MQLGQGDLERALNSLQQYTSAFAPKRQNDVAVLKATFSNAKRQFEVKGLMTRPEYDLVFARTVNGIQNIIETEGVDSPGAVKRNPKRWIWILTGVILVLSIVSYRYFTNGVGSKEERPLDTIVQENTALQVPEGTEAEVVKDKISSEPHPTLEEDKSQKEEASATIKTPEQENLVAKEEKPSEKPKEYLEVKLVVNAAYSDAQIFVDDKAAVIIQNTPIIKTIRVEKKADMHRIELKGGEGPCTKNLLITTNGQKVTMNC